MSRPKRSAKFGNDRWYVTTLVPLYGAICASQPSSAASSRALKSVSFCWKNALSFGTELRELVHDLLRDALAVLRIHPVVRVAERVDVAHGARHLAGRQLENRCLQRGVDIAVAPG